MWNRVGLNEVIAKHSLRPVPGLVYKRLEGVIVFISRYWHHVYLKINVYLLVFSQSPTTSIYYACIKKKNIFKKKI